MITHLQCKCGTAVLALVTTVCLSLTTATRSMAADEVANAFGPIVHDGPTLDHSISELNVAIRDQYAQEALLASLHSHSPVADEDRFNEVAAASAGSTRQPAAQALGAFGPSVFDDASLEESVAVLNEDLIARGNDPFLMMAENAARPAELVSGQSFDYVAEMLGSQLRAEALKEVDLSQEGDFGIVVRDGKTLQVNLAELNDEIQEREAKAYLLASDNPLPITGASFKSYAMSVANIVGRG